MRFANDFHSWLRHSWKLLANRLTRDPKIVIHGNSCIILYIIGSDNGLSPGRRQSIIWTNAGILLIEPLGANFSEILIEILTFSFKKMRFKVASAKWRPFCLGLNGLSIWVLLVTLLSWCEYVRTPMMINQHWFRLWCSFCSCRDSHYKDQTIKRLCYLHNGNSYADKMASLYWNTFQHCLLQGGLNIKMSFSQYRDPHVKDKKVSQPCYL